MPSPDACYKKSTITWVVDSSFRPDTGIRRNVTGEPRFALVAPFMSKNRVMNRVRPFLVKRLTGSISRVKQRVLVKPPIPAQAAGELRNAYRNDVERLSEVLGRDLTFWLETPS